MRVSVMLCMIPEKRLYDFEVHKIYVGKDNKCIEMKTKPKKKNCYTCLYVWCSYYIGDTY